MSEDPTAITIIWKNCYLKKCKMQLINKNLFHFPLWKFQSLCCTWPWLSSLYKCTTQSVIYKLFEGRHNDDENANADEKLLKFINMMKPRDFLTRVNLNNVILFENETVVSFSSEQHLLGEHNRPRRCVNDRKID